MVLQLISSLRLAIFLLLRSRIVRIVERIVLERPIEPAAIVRRERDAVLQPLHQVRVADEVAAVEQGVVLARLEHAPRVRIVPAAGREEGRGAEDLAECVEGHVGQAPALEEAVLLFVAEDLLVALVGFFISYLGSFDGVRAGVRLTGSIKLTYDSDGCCSFRDLQR